MEEFAGTVSSRLSGQTNKLLLPCLYLPPVIFFSCLDENGICLEVHDHYTKQTFRNRTVILGANGPLSLSIPVVKKSGTRQVMKDIRIDYSTPWQKLHWRGITSAYTASPYFEYYMDDYRPFYTKKTGYLADLNEELLEVTLKLLGTGISLERSTDFTFPVNENDPREAFSPKRDILAENSWFTPLPYHQVFNEKFGFVPNLGILDLLFNVGPEARTVIRKSKTG